MASTVSSSSALSPNFTATGLASGLDTASIVDQLVAIESRSVTLAQNRQVAFNTQISQLGDLTSKLQAVNTAAAALGTDGVLGVTGVGSASGFTATPSSLANPGSYAVQVTGLASPAKARSASFAADVKVTGGTLSLSVNSVTTDIAIDDGATLEQVATSINQSAAGVSAAVLTSGGNRYLSLTRRDTGFVVGQAAGSALAVTESYTGAQGQALGLGITQPATNASLTVDGLPFERSSNTISDVVPGVTLALTSKTAASEDLVLATDTSATKTNLQKFVDAYNALMKTVRQHLSPQSTTDTTRTLAGDPSLRSLQGGLQRLISGSLTTSSTVRSLADVGIRTGSDGTLSIDETRLGKAIGTDSQAVNALFQTAATGIAASTKALSDRFTNTVDGLFTLRTAGIGRSVKDLDTTIATLQYRVAGYRKTLTAQFAAMEKVVSAFKTIGDYMTQQSNAANNASK
jgi:flagellar hook-associated protein 2